MPTIQFLPQNIQVEIDSDSTLLDALNAAQIDIEYACGGTGICGRCLVRIVSGKVDFKNRGILDSTSIEKGYVLACRTNILDTPLIIEVPKQETLLEGKFIEQEDETIANQPNFLPKNWKFSGFICWYYHGFR